MATIELTAADGLKVDGYLTGPANATKGIVVLQEIFGVNHHIRDMADRFAAAGYKVIAPAMFDRAGKKGVDLGYGPDDRKEGFGTKQQIDDGKAVQDVEAAAKALGVQSVGVVGYCWGGSMAWLGATRTHAFKAAVCWYGGGIPATKDEKPNCPVQMHFGEEDGGIPMDQVEAVKKAQPDVEVYTYPKAGHGFGCNERDSFNKEAYELAQQRTLEFFKKHL